MCNKCKIMLHNVEVTRKTFFKTLFEEHGINLSFKKKSKTDDYVIFDSRKHDTDLEYYWISTLCTNCFQNHQIAIRKDSKVSKKKILKVRCPKCKLKNVLYRARWNGNEYKVYDP